MSFLIQCDNKKCLQLQAAKLDKTSNEVICQECGESITNITYFAKQQLKSLGQTIDKTKSKETFAVKCSSCSAEGKPIILNDKFCCNNCKEELDNLSHSFKYLLKLHFKNDKE